MNLKISGFLGENYVLKLLWGVLKCCGLSGDCVKRRFGEYGKWRLNKYGKCNKKGKFKFGKKG
jgi:hypothetical protein